MPYNQNQSQNLVPEENSIPVSPQEPKEPAPINTAYSEPSVVPPEASEALGNDFSVKSNDIPLSNPTPTEAENEPKTEEKQVQNDPVPKPISEPVEAPESETAQTTGNEPLAEPKQSEIQSPTPTEVIAPAIVQVARNPIHELLAKAKNAIQFRKRKKLDKIMSLFLKQSKITNDEVEKFLHVSDATATRYLSQLEKEGKIQQSGKTGKAVSYSRI